MSKESDMDVKTRRAMERVSENMHVVANEPSLALYRLQEHVRKALPQMVDKRADFVQLHEQLQGRFFDVEYSVSAVNDMAKADESFASCAESLKNILFYRQQLKHRSEQQKQRNKQQSQSNSMYKRFSATEPPPSAAQEGPSPPPVRPQSTTYQ